MGVGVDGKQHGLIALNERLLVIPELIRTPYFCKI